MKVGDTTRLAPAVSGTWYPPYAARPTGQPTQDLYKARRTSERQALVSNSGSAARSARMARAPSAAAHTRSTAAAAATSAASASPISGRSTFISMMVGMSGYRRRTSRSLGMPTPWPRKECSPRASRYRNPASARASSSAVRAATGPDRSVVRSSVPSWQTTTTPSADRWTSSSRPSAPDAWPLSNAAIVFSGPRAHPPRWAKTRGLDDPKKGTMHCRISP